MSKGSTLNKGSILKSWSIAFGLLMAVFACASSTSLVDSEIFRDMALYRDGALQAETPRVGQWGIGALYYGFAVTTGWDVKGILILKYLFCFGIAIACHGLAVRKRVSLLNFALLAVVAIGIAIPVEMGQLQGSLVSAALLIGLLHLIHADRSKGGFWIWLSIPLMVVWVNLHGSVIVGIAILATYVYSRVCEQYCENRLLFSSLNRDMYLIFVLTACGIGLQINPYGWHVFGQLANEMTANDSWFVGNAPIWTLDSWIAQVSFLVAFAIASYGVLKANPWPIFESIVLALVAILAILKVQFIPHFVILWLCLVPPLIERTDLSLWFQQQADRWSGKIAAVSASLGLVALAFSFNARLWTETFPVQSIASDRPSRTFPVGALDYLQSTRFNGSLFVPYEASGYAQWKLFPAICVQSDNISNSEYAARNLEARKRSREAADEWNISLKKSNIGALLIPVDDPIYKGLARSAEPSNRFDWRKVYVDRTHAVFVRNVVDVKEQLAERE